MHACIHTYIHTHTHTHTHIDTSSIQACTHTHIHDLLLEVWKRSQEARQAEEAEHA